MTNEQQYLESKGIKDEPLPRLSQDQSMIGEVMLSKLISDYDRARKQEIEITKRVIIFMAKSIKAIMVETKHRKIKQKIKGILDMANKIYKNENGIY